MGLRCRIVSENINKINKKMKKNAGPTKDSFYVPPEDNWRMKVTLYFRKRKKFFRILAILLVLALLVFVFFWQRRLKALLSVSQVPDVATQIPPDTTADTFANDVSGVSPAIETSTGNQKNLIAVSKSEKYQIKEISFGSNTQLLTSETETMPLNVTDVRSEMLSSKDGSQTNLLIRWKTNKMAASEVTYENGGISKKLSEGGFGYSHALVLSDLEQSKRYTFSILATDRWSNQKKSEDFSIYTGKKNASVFDLITQQFNQIFSWAIKK